MRICLVSQEYPPETGGGGIGTQTYLKAHGLAARGHEITVVAASWDRIQRRYHDDEIDVVRVAEPSLSVPGYETASYWLAYSTALAAILTSLEASTSFDIVQFPEYGGEGLIYQCDTFQYRTARYVVQLHGPLAMFADHIGWPEHASTLYRIGSFVEQTVMEYADRIIASSDNTARFCSRRYGVNYGEIDVVHSGIDQAAFVPPTVTGSNSGPRVLFVGNLTASKGLGTVVEAVLRLRARYPAIVLRIVGRDEGDFAQRLKRRIRDAGAQTHFDFSGYVPYRELPQHYGWCDIFAAPSTYEPGPGNVYLEAMSCGRPVIACGTGGTPEVVVHGQTGLLVDPGDVPALTEAIVALTDDVELKTRLGANAREWIAENFTLERYAAKIEEIYTSLLREVAITE
jgi:glycosyltransferase involved in cell wall biosynthesis